jgi:recombination associated protein RdgC
MWFRNLQIFRLTEALSLDPETLHERMEPQAFRTCGPLEAETLGWDRPLGREGDRLAHGAGGCVLVCARQEERVLPAAVVREALEERLAQVEAREGRPVRGRERRQLREDLVDELLPRAFTRSRRVFAYLEPRAGWVVVDTPVVKRAEAVLGLLRDSLGSLPVEPLGVKGDPAAIMTRWLRDGPAPGFRLTDECELREPLEGGGVVRCRRQDLAADEVTAHLEAGKRAVRLGVEWGDRLACVLGDDLIVRRLGFLDVVQEEAERTEAEDAAARLDADFALMTLELGRFLPALAEALGGLESRSA